MASCGANMVAETGPEWTFSRASGPRCGVVVGGTALSLRRLAPRLRALGMRFVLAGGPSDFFVDHTPMVPSAEAERRREEGTWMARASTLDLCP